MRIDINNQSLDLPDGFTIDIEDKSPIFNDRGSQTIPVTLPPTPRNLAALGFPHRIDITTRPLGGATASPITCRVTTGAWSRTGQVNVISASHDEGITINIGFDNSEAYSQWQGKSLRQLTLPKEQFSSTAALCAHLTQVWAAGYDPEAPYALPEVIIDNPSATVNSQEQFYPVILNQYNVQLITSQRTETQLIDSKPTRVALPEGYGVTPMLYLWRVVEFVFAEFGFTVTDNPFATDPSLRRLITLNNTADAATTPTLDWADLMPDVTVEQFLDTLWARFGMVYHVNSERRTVAIRLIRDVVADTPQVDITPLTTSWPLVTYQQPRQLRLSAPTSFEGAAPPAERYEDFIHNQPTPTDVARFSDDITTSLVYERTTARYYKWDRVNVANQFVGSAHFNWDRKTASVEDYDITANDESLPMMWVGDHLAPAYLAGALHRHTYIRIANKPQQEDKQQTPLAIAIALPTSHPTVLGATITPYDNQGRRISFPFSLTWQRTDGLFVTFWKTYDAILRHAMHQVEVTARLPLTSLNPLTPVSLQGHPMLIDSVHYAAALSQPHTGHINATITLRTLRALKPMDLETEQQVMDGTQTASGLMWQQQSSTLADRINVLLQQHLADARTEAVSDYGLIGTVSVESRGHTVNYDITPETDPEVRDNPPQTAGLALQRQYTARVTTYVWIAGNDSRGEYVQDTYTYTDSIFYTVTFLSVDAG